MSTAAFTLRAKGRTARKVDASVQAQVIHTAKATGTATQTHQRSDFGMLKKSEYSYRRGSVSDA